MFGMIKRYLRGRARIIARAQMQNALKKVAKSIRDGKDSSKNSNDSAISNAIKGSVRKKSALSQIMAIIVSASLVAPYNVNAAVTVVEDPNLLAQTVQNALDAIEKYNQMIKTAEDTLDTMNKVNDLMNAGNRMLNNLQTGIADPTKLWDRFQANLESIKDNAKRIEKSLQNRDWVDTFYTSNYRTCVSKWAQVKTYYETLKAKEELAIQAEGKSPAQLVELHKKYKQKELEITQKANWLGYADTMKGWDDANNQMQNWADYAISWVDVDKLKSTPIFQNSYSIKQDKDSSGDSGSSSGKDSAENQKDMTQAMQQAEEQAAMEAAQKIKQELVEVRKNGGTPNKQKMQQDICNLVEEVELEIARSEALSCYDEAKRKKDNKKATQCLKQLRDASAKKIEANRAKWKNVARKANFIFNDETIATLDIDENNGDLKPKKEEWELKMGKEIKENKEVAEEKSITMPSEKEGEKGTTKKVWVAKQDVIKELNEKGKKADALQLQNKRNMVIALQGDNQAIAQSQLETAIMTNEILSKLSNSVNQIGEVMATYADINESQKYNKYEEDLNAHYDSIHSVETNYDFRGEDALFEYEYGVPKLKRRNKSSSGIGSLD